MHISELTFKKKAVFFFLLIAIMVGGIISFDRISKLEDPELTVMIANVVTIYPGASAHEVEMQVTDVLEKEIGALTDINNITSRSAANVSVISVQLEMTVPQGEIAQRWEFLRRKIELAIPKLPNGCQTPTVYDDFGDVYGMFYAMTADGYTYEEMASQANRIKREMLDVEGVSKVQIYGQQQSCIDIVITDNKMSEMGVFPIQILSALSGQNSTVYAGVLGLSDDRVRIAVNDKIENIDDIENLVIKSIGGSIFKLSDIASVTEGYNDPIRNTFAVNNQKALSIALSMESGENIIKVGKRVEDKLEMLKKDIPVGYEFKKIFFQPDKVSEAINGFMRNLIMSVVIVIVVLMITMGLRSGLIIGSGLLLTILATFPILLATGGTLQRISLGAFIVAMGMLVDNSIVVIDGILVDLKRGKHKKKAFIDSAKRTAMPLLGATLIAISAFLPAFLSKDTAGTYIHDLFVVLCISLLVSWLLSMTQVPLFSAMWLKKIKMNKEEKEHADPYSGRMYRIIRRILSSLMNHKGITIALTTIALLIAGYSFKYVEQTFFPDFNYNQVYIEYKLPGGTSPEKVNEDLQQITSHFLSYDEVDLVASTQGGSPTRYSLVRAIGENSDSYGELIVNFKDYETMIQMKPVFEEYLRNNYPDAYARVRKYNLSIKSSHTVEVEFTGPDPAVLRKLTIQAENIMRSCDYVDKYTVNNDWENIGKIMKTDFDQVAAGRLGTTRQDVSNALLAASDGMPVATLYKGQRPITINLKTRQADGSRIIDLNDVPVWNMIPGTSAISQDNLMGVLTGAKAVDEVTKELVSPVPLSAVTNGVKMDWEELLVRRKNGERAMQAQCEPIGSYSPAAVRGAIIEDVEKIELPDGYAMNWMGEYELQGTALKNIFGLLPISILAIVLVLMLLFNDVRKPLIVLLCIPLAIIGIVPGLIVTGMSFTFIAIIGTLGLIGMLIKNSIVLLDEIENQINEGSNRYDAVINATVSRTRPVLMASITTILGMLPLFWDPMYASMAAAIISGLIVGTLITLIFVPILYAMLFKVRKEHDLPSLK